MLVKKIFFKIMKVILSPTRYAILVGVKVGKNCKLGTKKFGSEPYLISIGDDFYSSSNIQFITHDGSMHVLRNLYDSCKNVDYFGPIKIGNNVFIGYGCIILPNTHIGNNVIIGAGSIVKGKIESNSVYAGVPAKKISSIEDYFDKVKDRIVLTKHMKMFEKENFVRNFFEV